MVGSQLGSGSVWFPEDGQRAVVPRPGSGDVVLIDAVTLDVISVLSIGRQPLEAVLTASGEVVARDWETGDTLVFAS
jgi:YVTN family beta-propeller protein